MIEPPKNWDKNSAESNRGKNRDSLFLLTEISIADRTDTLNARVRNLSEGGMMVECDLDANQGDAIVAQLRNVGAVKGRVAWIKDGRYGISFDNPIDPKLARKPVGNGEKTPRFARPIETPRSIRPR